MLHFALILNSLSAFAATVAVKGLLLLAVALLSTRLCKRAAVRHRILSCAMLGLLALPLASLALPTYSLHLFPAGTPEADPDFEALRHTDQTGRERSQNATLKDTAAKPTSAAAVMPTPFMVSGFLGLLFLLGSGVVLARMRIGIRSARALLRTAKPLLDTDWQMLLEDAMQKLDIRQPIGLFQTVETAVPLTLGIRRPLILLPADAPSWPIARRQCVLLHELAHIKRRDCLLSGLAQVACALHFCNPLAWLAERVMRSDREVAADDLVLAAGVRPTGYASVLLDVARGLRLANQAEWAMAMAGRTRLEGRLRRILDPRADHRPLGRRGSIATALLAIGLLLPLSALRGLAAPPARTSAGDQAIEKLRAQVSDSLAKSIGKRPARVDLTIDPIAQALVEEELDAINQNFHPQKASIVVMTPQSGAILGIGSRGGGARNLAIDDVYEPASTVKVFTIATALDSGSITPNQRFATASDVSGVHDAAPANELSVTDILVRSSNIGTLKIYRTLGKERLLAGFQRFHFGEAPPFELATAAGTKLSADFSESRVEAVSFGHQMTASPLQIAAAFSAVANHGVYQAPTLIDKALGGSGELLYQHTARPEQVVKAPIADTVLRMIEGVVQNDDGTGTNARVAGYRVAGKTGTSDTAGLFIGAAPADAPAFVILVIVDHPQSARSGEPAVGNVVAAPSFRRIAQRLLADPRRAAHL